MSYITAVEFLARTKLEEQRQGPGGRFRPGRDPRPISGTINRLFAAGLDRKEAIEQLIAQLQKAGVSVSFEDNKHQPNYAPRIAITGENRNLLAATCIVADQAHPDEVSLAGNTVYFWWD